MGVTVHINYEAEIDEWISKYPCFDFLRHIKFPNDEKHRWTTNDSHWNYVDKATYELQVMFIGKTGYGKSTTLNKLVGSSVFETSDVSVCTKDLYNSMYRINSDIPSFFVISDLPGIGESNYADSHYYDWYREMLGYSQVVVYLLRADQRDFAVDEVLFNSMFKNDIDRSKVILALNYADKVEPINRKSELSAEQLDSLKRKINEISRIFDFSKDDILYYSATDGINFQGLVTKIAEKLKNNIYK